MKLVTKELEAKIPAMYSTEKIPAKEKIAVLKFFNPTGRGTWYGVEGEKDEDGHWTFFGYCVSPLGEDCDEWGYFSTREMEGAWIERDLYWKPAVIPEVQP